MIYYVRTKSGDFFKLDYPCFGMLSYLNQLQSSSWRHDIETLVAGDWEECHGSSSYGQYQPINGFRPSDLETLFLPAYGQNYDITHPFFSNLSRGTMPQEIPDSTAECYIMEFKSTPCDALFMPLFALREVVEHNSNASIVSLVESYGCPSNLSLFFGATFYTSTIFDRENGGVKSVYYPHQEDGGTFSNGKIGDLVAIMNGEEPRYMSSNWGDLDRGYPSYGVSEIDPEDDDEVEYEPTDHVSQRNHHMNDSLILQRTYQDEFLNKHVTASEFNQMSEQEFRSFVMEILTHVNNHNQSGT